jgi:alcohol dehydrogenase
MIDHDPNRLEIAQRFGATACIDGGQEDPVVKVMELTEAVGVDCAIEAVGIPATFELCESLVAPVWDRNIAITTRLVDTVSTPMLLKTVRAGRLDPKRLITHHFPLSDLVAAYDTFSRAADTRALKVIIEV